MCLQIITEDASSAPAPAPVGAQQCAATEEEALDLRVTALLLVLTGVGQALVGMAADVALAGSLRVLGGCLVAAAHLLGAMNAGFLCYVVGRMGVLAIGHCAAAGPYFGGLAAVSAFVAVSYAGLLGVSLAVTCC